MNVVSSHRTCWGPAVLAGILCGISSIAAFEPAEEFLAGLRERGYTELAVEYLERSRTSRLVDEPFREAIAYEQGLLLVRQALQRRDPLSKEAGLSAASDKFGEFCAQHPDHPLYLAAVNQMGNVLIERARMQVTEADRARTSIDRSTHTAQARQMFDEAQQLFSKNQQALKERLQAIPAQLDENQDAALIQQRSRLRADYVQAQLVAATIRYEQAHTFPADSREHADALSAASESFATVAEKYRTRLAGLYAVLYQGKCQQDLGQPKNALGLYQDLLMQPNQPEALRNLKTKALRQAVECWTSSDVREFDTAIEQGENWLKSQRPGDSGSADWLALRFRLAQAYQASAASGQAGRQKQQRLNEAHRNAFEVAKYPGEFQKQAQDLMQQLGRVVPESSDSPAPTTFEQARDAAKQAIDAREVANHTISLLEGRLQRISDEEVARQVRDRIEESKTQVQTNQQRAVELLHQAMRLADSETPLADLNTVRYYLCYLHWVEENFHDAAVLGEFLARHYPSMPESRQAAMIALAALVKLYGNGTDDVDRQFGPSLNRVAQLIVGRWPGQPEADEALNTLVSISIQNGEVQAAEGFLQRMTATSAKRGEAELRTGQALWNQYLQKIKSAPDAADAAPLKERAVMLLGGGLSRMQSVAPNAALVRAALALAQIYVDDGRTAQAIELLEDPHLGPKTLSDQRHPLAQGEGFSEQAYTLAILAYVAALPTADRPERLVEKALTTLDALQKSLPDTPAGRQRLVATYVTLAKSVERQIALAPAETKAVMSRGFEQFLERAAATSGDLHVLNWVADSFARLGEGLSTDTGQLPEEAQAYFAKSLDVYQRILEKGRNQQLELDPQLEDYIRLRVASTLRQMNSFRDSIQQFTQLLRQHEARVNVQMEAARTFQAWGDHGNQEAYLKAIQGDVADGPSNQNLIWGYARIAKLVANRPQLKDVFHDARYRLAECRYEYALQQPKAERTSTLRRAGQEITMIQKLYPDMGGAEKKQEYESLLRKIQQALGQ